MAGCAAPGGAVGAVARTGVGNEPTRACGWQGGDRRGTACPMLAKACSHKCCRWRRVDMHTD